MAKKPTKKIKSSAPKKTKPAKVAKGSGVGAALKKAVSSIAKKAKSSPKVKVAAPKKIPSKTKKGPSIPVKQVKKVSTSKVEKKVAVASKEKALKKVPAAKPEKKKREVLLEVPAPKGVAILGREKKKAKGSSDSAASSGKKRCREPACDNEATLLGYCRLHYIKNWRRIKRKEAILASGQLNNYVEELVSKYPDKYLDVIRQDLASEKDWAKVIVDLELESSEDDLVGDEELDTVAEGVRTSSRNNNDFDDDGDAF